MGIYEIELPDKLDGSFLEVEVDRISGSGTPIAYPVKEEYQGLFTGSDGIHLPEGEPGEVLEVRILFINESWAKAELTKSERKRRMDDEDKRNPVEEHRKEKKQRLKEWEERKAGKREKSTAHNEEFREELGEEVLDEALSESSDEGGDRVVEEDEDDEWRNRARDLRSELTGRKS